MLGPSGDIWSLVLMASCSNSFLVTRQMLMHEKTCMISIFIRELHPWIDRKLVHKVLSAGCTPIWLKTVIPCADQESFARVVPTLTFFFVFVFLERGEDPTNKQIQSNFDGSNSSGPSLRVRLIHVFERYLACQFSSWFMCSRCHHGHHVFYRLKVQSAHDTFHWSITLCTLELKW